MTLTMNAAKVPSFTSMNTATKQQHDQTQEIIQQLYNSSKIEYLTPSAGDAYPVKRDPHLRLRRTLAPSVNKGLPKYAEAQFMLSKDETVGKRLTLEFSVAFDNKLKHFTMHGYAFGASEAEADVRIVTLHGISSGVSRTRWHALGARLNAMQASGSWGKKKVRMVALDWHSIDRSVDDDSNTEYLTCLPKHIMEIPSENVDEMAQLYDTKEKQEWFRSFAAICNDVCPRTYDDGSNILCAVIEEGLGWGKKSTPFVLGIKCWSGGFGLRFLAQLCRSCTDEDKLFAENIQGAIIMHPACFDMKDINDVMSSRIVKSSLMCWAKDDPFVPYAATQLYLDAAKSNGSDHVKLITYETGGHHNFDGSGGLPNFDDNVMEWIEHL